MSGPSDRGYFGRKAARIDPNHRPPRNREVRYNGPLSDSRTTEGTRDTYTRENSGPGAGVTGSVSHDNESNTTATPGGSRVYTDENGMYRTPGQQGELMGRRKRYR